MVFKVACAVAARELGEIIIESCLTDKIAVIADEGVDIGLIGLILRLNRGQQTGQSRAYIGPVAY